MFNFLANATWYPFLFSAEDKTNLFRTIFFWLTIAVIFLAILLIALCKKQRGRVVKIVLSVIIGYACIVAITFLTLWFLEEEIVKILFYPLLITILCIGACAIILCFIKNKIARITCVLCCIGSFVATLVCMGMYFGSGKAEECNWLTVTKRESVMLYVSAILLISAIIVVAFLTSKKRKKGFDSKAISYGALCIALSFALSFIRIVKLPQEGSVTIASLLPLMVYSYAFGTKKGVFVGFIYGVMQALQEPYIVHPMQFMLDYPIAFAGIGLAGVFSNLKGLDKFPQIKLGLGAILGGVCRFIAHILSGVFAFSDYAGTDNAWVYSMTYNSFVFVDIAIVVVVGAILFSSKSFMAQISKIDE